MSSLLSAGRGPRGRMPFTVLTMSRGCAARRGESSGNLTNTLLVRVGFFFVVSGPTWLGDSEAPGF